MPPKGSAKAIVFSSDSDCTVSSADSEVVIDVDNEP
jgi:hypothetical protein